VEVLAGFARAPGAEVVADLARARAVEVVAELALEAGSGCLVDADFAVCDEVPGGLGVLLDPLVLGEVVVEVVVVPGLFFVFVGLVGLAVVVEPDAPRVAETEAWVVEPEAGRGVDGAD
jgi:hypothetical protein